MAQTRQTTVIDTKLENNAIIITRNIEDVFNIPSFLTFTDDEKIKILHHLNSKLSRLSFSKSAQENDLELILKNAQTKNEILNTILKNEKAHACLLELIVYAKYILDAKGDNKKEIEYTNKFKENLKALTNILGGNMDEYLQALSAADNDFLFLRLIPVAYYDFAIRELNLDDFRAGELMGHNIAYTVVENADKVKLNKLIIKSPEGKSLESYTIQALNVTKTLLNGEQVKDDALNCSIVVPEYKDNIPDQPVITIAWAGTYSHATIKADFQIAAGEESYRCSEDQIASQIVDAIQKFSEYCHKPVKVIFAGHSLGGALAQLSFHSLQRILATSIEDPELQIKVSQLEADFNSALDNLPAKFKLSLHQRSLHGIRLPTKYVSGMTIDVWSDADVLKPVEDHSNALSLLLSQHANITQTGNFARVFGGDLDYRRQGTILSKAGENGAKVCVLEVNSDPTGMKTTMKMPITGAIFGSCSFPILGFSILSCIPGAIAGALIGTMVMINGKWNAHSKKHFEGKNTLDPYKIYTSHHLDGSLNDDPQTGYKKIQKILASKSSVFDSAISFASSFGQYSPRLTSQRRYHENRFNSALRYAQSKDMNDGKGKFENMISVIASEMSSEELGANNRVLDAIKDKNLINYADKKGMTLLHHAIVKKNKLATTFLGMPGVDLNIQDNEGKTALHHAIEIEDYGLAEQMLNAKNININLQDAEGNSPMLLLMKNINNHFSKHSEVYNFGMHLLAHQANLGVINKKGESIEKIFKSWNWSGIGSARRFCHLLSQSLFKPTLKSLPTLFQGPVVPVIKKDGELVSNRVVP